MKRISLVNVAFCIIFILAACTGGNSSLEGVQDFTSIIDNNGADPWVYQDDQYYYYTKTTGRDVTLWRSDNLTMVTVGEEKTIWEMPVDLENIWAPELHHLNGSWVVYFAANRPLETHRMYALINENADPYTGDWVLSEVKGMDDKFAIDGTILDTPEQRYFVWSGWEVDENVAQNLYIAEMVSPIEITGTKVLISKPEFEWEKRQMPLINEGPQIITRNNTVNLVYSASGSWDNDYALGLITADISSDLLDPASWKKETEPIFSQTDQVFGPGHNGFAKSKDGSEDWLIYHAARWDHSGWDRSIRLQKIDWDEDDHLVLGSPLNDYEVQSLPKGESARLRLTADKAEKQGELTVKEDRDSLSGMVVTGFEDTQDSLTFAFSTEEGGDYSLIAYVKTEEYLTTTENIRLNIQVGETEFLEAVYPSQYYQPVQINTHFEKGEQQVMVSSDVGIDPLSVDRIELVRITQ